MNGLTLKKLRKAIHIIKTSKRFNQSRSIQRRAEATWLTDLEQAEAFLTGQRAVMPRDPREVLAALGYKG